MRLDVLSPAAGTHGAKRLGTSPALRQIDIVWAAVHGLAQHENREAAKLLACGWMSYLRPLAGMAPKGGDKPPRYG